MYCYQMVRQGKIVSKENLKKTVEVFKKNGIKIETLQVENMQNSGMWFETEEEKDILEGDIIKGNNINYMKLDNKVMRFYSINEIFEINGIDIKEVEKNIIVIYKTGIIDYFKYE